MSSMERWKNKVAVVTGTCNSIGADCSIALVKAGMIVTAFGVHEKLLNELKFKLPEELRGRIYTRKCDVSKEEDVIESFKWVSENLGPVHVLVNFATSISQDELVGKYCSPELKNCFEVNVIGVVYCTREAFAQMKENKIDGHIIILNSICGHYIPKLSMGSMNIFPAAKYANTAMAETYRQEFSNAGTNVKVTSISPGAVNADIGYNCYRDIIDIARLNPEDLSSAVVYCISTPPHVQIHEITIKSLHERF